LILSHQLLTRKRKYGQGSLRKAQNTPLHTVHVISNGRITARKYSGRLSLPSIICTLHFDYGVMHVHWQFNLICSELNRRTLRKLFKVDAADYMLSLCGDQALRELSSPGKSGSFFYLTSNDQYMIKTMKKSEVKVCVLSLSKYFLDSIDHQRLCC